MASLQVPEMSQKCSPKYQTILFNCITTEKPQLPYICVPNTLKSSRHLPAALRITHQITGKQVSRQKAPTLLVLSTDGLTSCKHFYRQGNTFSYQQFILRSIALCFCYVVPEYACCVFFPPYFSSAFMNTSYCDAQSCLLNSKISSAGTASCEQMTEPHIVMTTQLNLLDKASSKFPKVTC